MLEVLQYIFSSFWIWLGSFLMLGAIIYGGATMVVTVMAARIMAKHRADRKANGLGQDPNQ